MPGPNIKATFTIPQWAMQPVPNLRATFTSCNFAMYPAVTHFRTTLTVAETAEYQETPPHVRVCCFILQAVQPAPEVDEVTAQLPDMIGLTYPISVKPTFSTKIDTHTSGKETATSFWQYPRWTFDLSYDYLPYTPNAQQSDFAELCGFFLSMNGSFTTFLFNKKDDNTVTNYLLATSDGTSPSYDLVRPLGGYLEPVGQVDAPSVVVVVEPTLEDHVVGAGPYTVQATHHVGGIVDVLVKQGSTPYAPVVGSPGPGQYNVDLSTGIYTFNSGVSGQHVTLDYQYTAQQGVDYGIQLPRTLAFAAAPLAGSKIYTTFNFFYTCRFVDDQTDFDQFMDKLYELQKVSLITVLE